MEQQVNLTLSVNEINMVLAGLGKLQESTQMLTNKIASVAQSQLNGEIHDEQAG